MSIAPLAGSGIPITEGLRGHTLITVPSDDRLFSQIAGRWVRSVRAEKVALRTARRELRAAYPRADLHHQEQVVVGDRPIDMWFAYRDGRGGGSPPVDEWWVERSAASVVVASTGRLSDASAGVSDLLGVVGADLVPDDPGDLLMPAVARELAASSGSLHRLGELTTTAVLRRPAGGQLEVELHAVWDGAGPGRHQVSLRSMAERDASAERAAIDASRIGGIEARLRDELLRGATRLELQAGERLSESLRTDRWVVLVVSGLVRLHLMEDSLEPTLVYGAAGSLIGTHWTAPDDDFALGLQAVTPSRLLVLDAGRFETLATTHRQLAAALADEGRGMLRDVVGLYAIRSCAGLTRRLAREILLLAALHRDPTLLPVTEHQLADGVGSIRESVARALAELRRRGWIATTRHGLLILDQEALRRVAAEGIV